MSSRRTEPTSQGQQRPNPTGTATSSEGGGSEEKPKLNFDKLLEKLVARGISLMEFAHVQENRRKKMLQDDYQDIKNETGWMYDEPIEVPKEAFEKEAELREKRAAEAIAAAKK